MPTGLEEVELGWLSELFDLLAKNHPNPLVAIPAGTLVGPSALLDGTVFRGIHSSARASRRQIKNTVATSKDPIQKGVGVIALGYAYVGEGFALFGAAEGANAPISAGIALAFPPLPPSAMTTVSRWGRPGLETNDWVMRGPPSYTNYVLSGKWDPLPWNHFARYPSGQRYTVPANTLEWPHGWQHYKGIFGQRIYVGPGLPPPYLSGRASKGRSTWNNCVG
jgi:hypothetical protein